MALLLSFHKYKCIGTKPYQGKTLNIAKEGNGTPKENKEE